MIKSFTYNWLTIETNSVYTINDDNFDEGAIVENNSFVNPSSRWETNVTTYTRKKVLNISWKIKGTSLSDLNNKISEFKKALYWGLRELDVTIETWVWVYTIRRTNAIVTNKQTIVRQPGNITFCTFNIEFYIPKGYYRDTSFSTITWSWSTTEIVSWTYDWNTETNLKTEIQLSSPWITSVEVITNNWKLRIEETFRDTDTIVINWETNQVLLNWLPVDFSWELNEWLWEDITINVNWSFSYIISYYNKYI